MNEAALAVRFARVSHGVFVRGCVFVVQRRARRRLKGASLVMPEEHGRSVELPAQRPL